MSDILQSIWPEWQIEGKPLGRGSFGVVYKAVRRDHGVESYAAIKVISIPTDQSELDSLLSEGLALNATRTYLQGVLNNFVNEIRLMESLKGAPNIVNIEDYKVVERRGEIGWDIYIRMELLTSIDTYFCDKKITEDDVIKLGCDMCTALENCTKRGIIHRDIKPGNILVDDFGYFKLGDFGIARTMENIAGGLSQRKGTENYMAPEVANSREYDSRVDIYSLGIVMYRLLNNNRLPFMDSKKQLLNHVDREIAVKRRMRGEKLPAPCDASPRMVNLILKACAHGPNERFADASEMKTALMRVLQAPHKNNSYASDVSRIPYTHKDDEMGTPPSTSAQEDKTWSVRKVLETESSDTGNQIGLFGYDKSNKPMNNSKPSLFSRVGHIFNRPQRNNVGKKVVLDSPQHEVSNFRTDLPNDDADVVMAYDCIRNENYGEAKRLFTKALEKYRRGMTNQSELDELSALEMAKIFVALGILWKEAGQPERAKQCYEIERTVCEKYAIAEQKKKHGWVAEDYFDQTRKNIGITSAWGTNKYIEHLLVEEINVYRLLCQHDSLRYYRELCMRLKRYGILLDQTSRYEEGIEILSELLLYYEKVQYNTTEIKNIRQRIERMNEQLLKHI